MSYGPVSNDDLLQYYGFVERDNPADAYVLQDMGKWLREVCLLLSMADPGQMHKHTITHENLKKQQLQLFCGVWELTTSPEVI